MGAVGYVLLAVAIVLIIVTMVLLIMLLRKKDNNQQTDNSLVVIAELNKIKNELSISFERSNVMINGQVANLSTNIKDLTERYDRFMMNMNGQLEQIRKDNNDALLKMREDNSKEMEKMREVVDQKLSENIEQKFNSSFKLVSDRMSELTKEFQELQNLQTSVKDLNSIFKNVKTRGTWGEVSLDNLLSQILTPDQFAKQVSVKKSTSDRDRVDFAVVLPGKGDGKDKTLLPIDSKLPLDNYQRLVEASAQSDAEGVDLALKALLANIKTEAKSISEKYINPPTTTDFAIMYLPIEGLYAEVVQQTGLMEVLQTEYGVNVAGPSTLASLLNTIRMGFRSIAIEKRSKEIADIMIKFQKDFANFASYLDKMGKNINTLQNSLEDARKKNDKIQKTLSKVQVTDGTGTEYIEADDIDVPQIGLIEEDDD